VEGREHLGTLGMHHAKHVDLDRQHRLSCTETKRDARKPIAFIDLVQQARDEERVVA
jgi:hypothetical protein